MSTGLTEGLVNNNTTVLDTTTPFANWTQVTVQPTARWGASTTSGGTNVYPAGATIRPGDMQATWTTPPTPRSPTPSARYFDDDGYLSIDGNILIDDSTYTNAITATVTLSPGLHTLDLLFGQGTGGVGPTGPDYGSFGIGYNTVGNTATSGTWLQIWPKLFRYLFLPGEFGSAPHHLLRGAFQQRHVRYLRHRGAGVAIGSLADASGNPTGQQVLLGSSTLITGNDNTDTTFSGVISGDRRKPDSERHRNLYAAAQHLYRHHHGYGRHARYRARHRQPHRQQPARQ